MTNRAQGTHRDKTAILILHIRLEIPQTVAEMDRHMLYLSAGFRTCMGKNAGRACAATGLL
ncbi:hypothetical protein BJY01DRAFT_209301 [Aspergillus pseudoustus]|uniref:Uncharacterized protein n=1 Tax=Aspergillus pseudoustus TaxID=1810923 RepID=A0ABR4KGK4_9EURO